jgi:hypothetical protein
MWSFRWSASGVVRICIRTVEFTARYLSVGFYIYVLVHNWFAGCCHAVQFLAVWIFFLNFERCNMLYVVFSLHGACYMSDVYNYAVRSVTIHYDYHYYCCDNTQYRNIVVINQVKKEGVGMKCVS